jgi:uncharacterized protein with ParB-like and HNH nuclease domain
MSEELWYVEEDEEEEEFPVKEYDITSTPNDFNIRTIFDFIESGLLKIPAFQRNYVWDQKRASKLIESLIIGLPIPQIFLYEESKNSFQVIDGQQRLLSIFYFKKKRFPRMEKRAALRRVFDEAGGIPPEVLADDTYFANFNLQLPSPLPNQPNPFNKLNYDTLGEHRATFDLRTMRNIVVRQNSPDGDEDSSIYEIFNRLNSGGVNLKPQEIRVSLYHSKFYLMLNRLNARSKWREFVGSSEPDIHSKDIEVLLRGFSMLFYGKEYKPSITKFLNLSSRKFKSITDEAVKYCELLFDSFLIACSDLDSKAFIGRQNNRFNISTFEAVFVAATRKPFQERRLVIAQINPNKLDQLKSDSRFIDATQKNTASTENVKLRASKATEYIG